MPPRKNTDGRRLLALVILACSLQPISGQPQSGVADGPAEVQRQVYLMGTSCTLTAEAPDRATGLARLEALLKVLEQTEEQLSTWRDDSRLTLLNRTPAGSPFRLSGSMCRLFEDLFRWHERTHGAFDPTVGELIRAWGLRQGGRLPDPQTLQQALALSGMEHLQFDAAGCQVIRLRAVTFDAGAFGKGEALDRARRLSRQQNLAPWMIDLGGQVMVEGSPAGTAGWQVDLAHPLRRQEPLLRLRLAEGSLAVSGGSERDLQVDGQRVGHILDPRSGRPAAFVGSAAVWHQDALAADILSTAIYVMGPQEGLDWAELHGLAACFLSASPARMACSSAFRRRFLSE